MAPKPSSKRPAGAVVHVALLRGVNVGGKNILPMAKLAQIVVDAGCNNVKTYIQSGNVVFSAAESLAKRVPKLVSQAIQEQFGFQPALVLRSADELASVASANPFLRAGADAKALHVGFLEAEPSADRIARLDPKRSPGDGFHVRGREIYLHFPNGVHGSKLTNAYIDSALSTTSTVRNWRTVLKLCELAGVPALG